MCSTFDPQGMIGFGLAISGIAFAIAWVKVTHIKARLASGRNP